MKAVLCIVFFVCQESSTFCTIFLINKTLCEYVIDACGTPLCSI